MSFGNDFFNRNIIAKARASGLLGKDDPEYLLRNLLAVAFGDGGERTATFPTLAAAVEEAIRVVAEGNAAREQIEAWQDASGLERGGDPGGVTPDDLANDLLQRDRDMRAVEAERDKARVELDAARATIARLQSGPGDDEAVDAIDAGSPTEPTLLPDARCPACVLGVVCLAHVPKVTP